LVILLFWGIISFSQSNSAFQGVVRDLSSNLPVPGVAIRVEGKETGVITDANGTFRILLPIGSHSLVFTHVSYQEMRVRIEITKTQTGNLGNFYIEPRVIGLDEVHIISSYITDRGIPVATTTVGAKTIERQIGNQDFPEILKHTPGVYATKVGGGSGDDRLTIRGFQQENIALLLNGVPVSSMENGLVYWSNWIGLTDATEAIQVQRGLGASKVAMNSVGGTVNIITKSIQSEQGGSFRYSLSDYGNQRSILQFSTGEMKGGTAITFLGSRTTGPGYVDGTYTNGWAYFLSVSKKLGRNHQLVFTALGSPERHGQRNYAMSQSEFLQYGNKYNKSWGVMNGKILNLSENFYHKPQINLNHYWNAGARTLITSSAYVSFGKGGGRYTEAFNYGPSLYSFRKNDQIDFDRAFLTNIQNQDSFQLADQSWIKGYSKNILTNYRANHYWAGILSSMHYQISDKMKLIAGVHFRTFKSHLYEEIDHLLGGAFWIEQYAWSLGGISNRPQIKKVGEIINVNNYSYMNYGNLFGQLEYGSEKVQWFLASTISQTYYQRKDPYNYPENPLSERVMKSGFDAKTGLGYRTGKHSKLYANLGYYSREPYFKFVFVNFSNAQARDLRNEKIIAAEIGYEYSNGMISSRLNGYSTMWKDKSMLSRENIQLSDSSLTRSLVKGLNALHIGLEWESVFLIYRNINLTTSFSVGNWKWQNDVTASIYNDNQVLIDSTRIFSKGLYVGDAPQTQVGISLDYTFLQQFNLTASWVYYDRLYSNFEPSNRTKEGDRTQPYRIPSYGLADVYLSYDFEVKDISSRLQISCQNLFDKEVITRGDDGADHTIDTFKGFWSMGRTFNVSMKMAF